VGILSAKLKEFQVLALFDDSSFFEYDYAVSALYCRKPMGDNQGCPASHQ
jgi:hypothetical protein